MVPPLTACVKANVGLCIRYILEGGARSVFFVNEW